MALNCKSDANAWTARQNNVSFGDCFLLMVEQGGIIQISNTNLDTFLTYISIRDCRKFVVNYSKREYWVRGKQKRRQWAKVS